MPLALDDELSDLVYLVRLGRSKGAVCELEDLRTCQSRAFASVETMCTFLVEAWASHDPGLVTASEVPPHLETP